MLSGVTSVGRVLPGVAEGGLIVNIHFLPTSGPGPRVLSVVRGGGGRGGGGGGRGGGRVLATFLHLSGPEHDSHHLQLHQTKNLGQIFLSSRRRNSPVN